MRFSTIAYNYKCDILGSFRTAWPYGKVIGNAASSESFKDNKLDCIHLQDAAQRSRQKRIEGTKKLQLQNTDYHGLLRREEENIRAAERERANVLKDLEEMTKKLERQRMKVKEVNEEFLFLQRNDQQRSHLNTQQQIK